MSSKTRLPDSSKGVLTVVGTILLFVFIHQHWSYTPVPPTPIVDDTETAITQAARFAIRDYTSAMAQSHKDAADKFLKGELDSLEAAHDYLSPINADARKTAFSKLGALIDQIDTTDKDACAKALKEAAQGYERVSNGIK